MKSSTTASLALLLTTLAAASLHAETIITDFTYDLSNVGASSPRPAAYDGQPNTFANINTTSSEFANGGGTEWNQSTVQVGTSHLFSYTISSLGIGFATRLDITVSTVGGGANLSPAAGNGIAVYGGDNVNWLDDSDPNISFAVVIRDSLNADITSNFTVDLTGIAMRWASVAPLTVAGQSIVHAGGTSLNPPTNSVWQEGVNLTTGQTAETSFTAAATAHNQVMQIQQLRFTIAAAPDTSAPIITALSPTDNATGVPVGKRLVATFNENIALTGAGTVTIRDLTPGPDTVITLPSAQVTFTESRKLVINPTSDLLPNKNYAIQISADAIEDLADPPNAFAGISTDTTWNFSTSGPPPSVPNVIVYLMDDLGLTDVQQHPTYFPDGSPLFETPSMHRLASEGMRFTHAYTQPLCSASRGSLMSGQDTAARRSLYMAIVNTSVPNPSLPATSGATAVYNHPTDRDHLPLDIETIAERLKAAGYATWHAGKWHLSPSVTNTAYYPDKQGFDKQLGVGGSGPPSYFGPFGAIPNLVDHLGNPAPGTTGVHIGDHMAKLVQNMMDHHLATNSSKPFFLYYPAYSVHSPHEAKKSLFNYYQTKLAGLPDSKHRHPVFAAQVHMADKELGSMLDYIDDKGLTDNTILMFLSDNGGLSIELSSGQVVDDIGSDGIADDLPNNSVNGNYAKANSPIASTRMTDMTPRRAGKGSLFEGGIRIPMIVRYPGGGISSGSASDEAVKLADIYQTILDYTPATALPGYTLDGLSLKPLLDQTGSLPDRDIFVHFPRNNETWGTLFLAAPGGYPDPDNYPFTVYPGGTAMINYPFKMIARYSTAHDATTVNYQLFRLDLDVGENDNVAGDYPEVVDAMRKRLQTYYLNTGALVPTRNPSYNGTSMNSPETTAKAFLATSGLTPNTPQTFLLADPDLDGRRNEDEFLMQTNPNGADASVATIWLYNNGTFGELRFAIPANVSQASFQILNANGTVAFTPSSGLTLDGQYGPFYVYKPTTAQPGGLPGNYRISLVPPTPAPSLTPDTDQDGLPDAFESPNGLNPNNPADGNADNDGDGFTRGQEYLAGTSDFNSNDFTRLHFLGQPDSGHSLLFDLKNQKAYRLHKSSDLANWTLWEDFGVISGNQQAVLALTNERTREFYRLESYQP